MANLTTFFGVDTPKIPFKMPASADDGALCE